MLEWGYYEDKEPRLVDAEDIGNPDKTMTSPSMRHLALEEIAEPLEKAFQTTPILNELGWDERSSFNGLLSVTSDAGSLIGESPEVRGFGCARQSGLKMVLDARDCAPSGWSGAKLLWTCILLISPGFIRRKKKKLLLKHALSKTHKPSIHRPYIPENPISAKENYSSAHFIPERKSSVVT